LIEGARSGKPAVVAITGRAGAGKSRVAAESRDDARRKNLTVKMLAFGTDEHSNEEQWIRFFAWLFGVSNNVFHLNERRLVEASLEKMDAVADADERRWNTVIRHLAHMLKARTLVDDLFDEGTVEARHFRLMVERALSQRDHGLIVHLEDAHHLSTRLMAPLWLLRRVLHPPSRLHAVVTLTARNDETVTQTAIGNFLMDRAGLKEYELDDFGEQDAQAFVRGALRTAPELISEENYFVSEVIRRAGRNPFALTQTVESILASDEAFERRRNLDIVIIQSSVELEKALQSVPEGVREILRERFRRLVDRPAGRTLFEILLMAAVLGRGASVALIERALKIRDSRAMLKQLVQMGYVKNVRAARIDLAHDVMAESLLRQKARGGAAAKLAEIVDAQRRPSATVEQRARIYFHAGRRYYRRSWTLLTQVVRAANSIENYSQILASAPMIDTIVETGQKRGIDDRDIDAQIAGAYGHSGRTSVAIARYQAAAAAWEPAATSDVQAQLEYVRLRIQLANQHSTRGEIEQALTIARDALDLLATSRLPLPSRSRADVQSFALNRMGAMHKVVEEFETAVALFRESLEICRSISKYYLMSNCLTNLATIYARHDLKGARAAVNEAIEITAKHLGHKGRRQVMVDTCKACVDCFESNDAASRFALRTTFIRAREAGYFGQITGALLPYAYFSLRADKVADAEWAANIVLDVCSTSEDWFARLFGRYYLAACYIAGGQTRLAQTFARSTLRLTHDTRILASPVAHALRDIMRSGAVRQDSLVPFTRV
jgi:tetratricopeptide (TPR) repeat protein